MMMLTTSGPEPFWVSAALRWAARPIPPDGPAMAPIESSQTAVGWFSTTRILVARDGCATASDSTSAFHSGLTYCVAPTYGFTWCASANTAAGAATVARADTPIKSVAAATRNLPRYACTISVLLQGIRRPARYTPPRLSSEAVPTGDARPL